MLKKFDVYIGQLLLFGLQWSVEAENEEEAERKFIASLDPYDLDRAKRMGVKIYEKLSL